MATEVRNAKVTSTMLGVEDHGIMSSMVMVEGDGWGCGFGGMAFDAPVRDASDKFIGRRGTAYGTEWVRKLLETLCLERWEQLPGTLVRVKTTGLGGGIEAIGHITKARWFAHSDVDKTPR